MNDPIIHTSTKGDYTLQFNPKTHRYYLQFPKDPKKRPLVSATTTSRGFPQSEELIKWRVKQGIEEYISGERLARAAEIGTFSHEIFIQIEKGEKPDVPNIEAVQNIVRLHKEWFEKEGKHDDVRAREIFVAHPEYMVGGTIDRYCIRDGKLILQDYKTTKGIYDSAFFQLAWYAILAEFWLGVKFDIWEIIRFGKEDDEYETKQLRDKEIMHDFREQAIRNLRTYRFSVKYKP